MEGTSRVSTGTMPRLNAWPVARRIQSAGLTYQDLNVGTYGYTNIPEDVRTSQSMVSRGSEKVGKLPDMGYVVNRKSDVWSDNVAELYEEVKGAAMGSRDRHPMDRAAYEAAAARS